MSGSKFAASRRPGKTPAICRKAVKPKPDTIPDSSHPIIHPKPLMCSIEWKSINPGHPWHYAARTRLYYVAGIEWFSEHSDDSDFAIEIHFWYDYVAAIYSAQSTANHQAHGDHVATSSPAAYEEGNAFYLPRFQLDVSPYPRYQCYISITI